MSSREKRIIVVGGIKTEQFIRTSPEAEKNSTKIIVTPGNPGLVDFYFEFVEDLFTRFDQKITVIAIGHAGHSTDHNNGAVYTLQDQIKHKSDFLHEHFDHSNSTSSKPKFILIGHSVGSYINLRVKKSSPQLDIVRTVNLFPTIQQLYDGLRPVVRVGILPGVRQTVGYMIHYVPAWFKKYCMRAYEGSHMPEEAQERALVLTSYTTLQNVLHMAYHETYEIQELDPSLLEEEEKHIFIFGHNDHYTPLDLHYHALKASFPRARIELCEDPKAPHAFVLTHSKQVAKEVHTYLTKPE